MSTTDPMGDAFDGPTGSILDWDLVPCSNESCPGKRLVLPPQWACSWHCRNLTNLKEAYWEVFQRMMRDGVPSPN